MPGMTPITDITNASPAVVTAANHNIVVGALCVIAKKTGMVGPGGETLNGVQFKAGPGTTTNTVELHDASDAPFDTTAWTPYQSGGQIGAGKIFT